MGFVLLGFVTLLITAVMTVLRFSDPTIVAMIYLAGLMFGLAFVF